MTSTPLADSRPHPREPKPSLPVADPVLDALQRQALSCAHVGSSLYGVLLDGLAADYDADGITRELLKDVSTAPVHDALPLRYLATAHHLALAGLAPDLASIYASCGGEWNGEDPTRLFLRVARTNRAAFENGVRTNVQTNEAARSAVLASGFSLISHRYGLPMSTLEIGSSAGLLSRWMHYGFDTGESTTGDAASQLQFGPLWWNAPLPRLDPAATVVSMRASDITPLDLSTAPGRLAMESFLWPDQVDRRARLLLALAVAQEHPLVVEQADAGEWLTDLLAADLPAGTATVVFHSIVWQYLPQATRETMRAALQRSGLTAEPDCPLLWLRMEPATAEHAALRLTSWPGGIDEELAHVGYHGADVRWLIAPALP